MHKVSKKTCLIIPCYNEEKRLCLDKFVEKNTVYYIFVNDGSTDNTSQLIRKNLRNNFYLLDLEKNVGKGEAIRLGVEYIRTLSIYETIEWLGFWDADLSTPLTELDNFFKYSLNFDKEVSAIFGSRIYKLGSTIERSFFRHILGRSFASIIGFVFNLKSYDSQCGAKLFRKSVIEIIFGEPFISKWIFDIEIIMRLKDNCIIEYPLMSWKDVKESKLKIVPNIYRILKDIYNIKNYYKIKHTKRIS
jgi:dolichyl-phosphate beta-glucosyltransferase